MTIKPRRHYSTRRFATLSLIASCAVIVSTILAPFSSSSTRGFAQTAGLLGEAAQVETREPSSGASKEALAKNANEYGRLPISFETNRGQTDKKVKFLARGQGYGLFLTSTGAVLSLHKSASKIGQNENAGIECDQLTIGDRAVLSLRLQGANPVARVSGVDQFEGKINYFVGKDPLKWRRNVETYSKVSYHNVYRGIDLVYYGNQQQLEYDLIVAPKANPRSIRLQFAGAEKMRIDAVGDLVLSTPSGDIVQRKPIAYQDANGERQEVAANYRLDGSAVKVEIGNYDRSKVLTIDPVLSYSTYFGGQFAEQGLAIAADAQGNAYITGSTGSADFPLVTPVQPIIGGVNDVFVTKLNPTGSAIVYSTFLGGNGDEFGQAIAVDLQGSAYVTGVTGSGTFPTTPGAYQTSKDGVVDAFVTKLSPAGSELAYSTFLGGNNTDTAFGIAVSEDGRAYVVGRVESTRLRSGLPISSHGSTVYKSTNAALSWTVSDAQITGTRVNAFAIQAGNSNIVYAGSNFGLFKSTDAGANWTLTGMSLSTNAIAIDPSSSDIVYVGSTSGVFKSTNGGAVFTAKNTGLTSLAINALAIDPTTPSTVYAGTNLGIFKTTNGGDSWVEIKDGIPGTSPRVNKVVLDPTDAAVVYIGTIRGVFKTTNGGGLWASINGGGITSSTQITGIVINPTKPAIVYAASANGHVSKTETGSGPWTDISVGLPPFIPITALDIDSGTPSTLYAGGGNLYKSIDSGATWLQTSAGLDNYVITAITVDRLNPATIYAGTSKGAEAFALRLDPSGATLEQFLSFGGNGNDEARAVALDESGLPYIAGSTDSTDFPTANAYQATNAGFTDGFVAKLNAAGTDFVYSTYIGGSGDDLARAIAVREGKAYVVGITTSRNYPQVNPLRLNFLEFPNDGFVTKLNESGSALDFSTYLSNSSVGTSFSLALDSIGGIYITGAAIGFFPTRFPIQSDFAGGASDAFIARLHSSGSSLVFSTYLGGTNTDVGNGIAVDPSGNVYIIGNTASTNFPTANPFKSFVNATDAFVSKLSANDIAILTTDSRDPVMVGNNLTYTLTVSNVGFQTMTGVTVSDNLPAGVVFVSATTSQGSCSGTTSLTCTLGDVAAEASATVFVVVTPQAVGPLTNTATVTSTATDSNAANNSSTQQTNVSAFPSIFGRIATATGVGAPFVNIALAGSHIASTSSGEEGFYQFQNLGQNGNYTVTPTQQGFAIHPQSQSTGNLTGDTTFNFEAVPCTFQISSTTSSFPATGANGSLMLTAVDSLCPWTATSDVPWLTITSTPNGTGSATINISVSPTVNARTGILRIANLLYVVKQDAPLSLSFSRATYSAGESEARLVVGVTRLNSAAPASVDYVTSDTAGLTNCSVVNGIASSRCDYATAVGTLNFAAGEKIKTISIPIVDDAYAEGSESFTITLSNASGAPLGTPATATVTITDNETSNGTNPVDLTPFFVRQQYVDFLGREPDPGGFAAWQNVINNCPAGDTTCDRIHVSSSFFRSPEFQGRGYFVYRFYPTAFGRKPDYVEFIPDLAKVSGFLSDAELEAAKLAFIAEFMSRPAFVTQYNGLSNTQYVDTLLSTAGITHVARDFWIAALGNGTRTRAQVLREIAESTQVYDKYYNQAFVVMQYFGYLRRDPDALYTDWIAHLNATGDYRSMINGFMNSLEYRFRFGP